MSEEIQEQEKISDQERIADLIIENQLLSHKVVVLAQLAVGASKVLDYYASSRLNLPTFTLVDHSEGEKQPLFSKAKYRIVEVLDTPGPDKEALVGKEMYDLKMDVETAERASQQILDKLKELDIIVEDKVEFEEESQDQENGQLHLDFSDGYKMFEKEGENENKEK